MNILGIYVDPAIVGFVILIIKCVVWIFALLTTFAYIQLVERWVIAKIQVRIGPSRTGPRGLLQPLADAVKALMKEELIPTNADKLVFVIAPMISVPPRSCQDLDSYEMCFPILTSSTGS